jgi:hypothetical protein
MDRAKRQVQLLANSKAMAVHVGKTPLSFNEAIRPRLTISLARD